MFLFIRFWREILFMVQHRKHDVFCLITLFAMISNAADRLGVLICGWSATKSSSLCLLYGSDVRTLIN